MSKQLWVSSRIHLVPVDIGREKENMTELLHKPIAEAKKSQGNINTEPCCLWTNAAKLSSSICFFIPLCILK